SVEHGAEIDELKAKVRAAAAMNQVPQQYRPTLTALRALLLDALQDEDLLWFTLDLKMNQHGPGTPKYTIQVCSPVIVSGFFIPVTAQETWDLASRFKAMPLSRAVSDQQVNEAINQGCFEEFSPQDINTHGVGFDVFTDKLLGKKYMSGYGHTPVSGSHKLWLV